MELWIGIEGYVYELLHVVSYPIIDNVGLAIEKEGTVGFLLENGTYLPVAYHSGKWVKAKKSELRNFRDTYLSEWYGMALTPPFEYHVLFESVIKQGED